MNIGESLKKLPRTLWWGADESGAEGIFLIDQTRLPLQGDTLFCHGVQGACTAIATLAVRGAPALGVMGAMTLALWAKNESDENTLGAFLAEMARVKERVDATRPTAVNLSWGTSRALEFARARVAELSGTSDGEDDAKAIARLTSDLVDFGKEMAAEDEAANRAIGAHASGLLADKPNNILTHCNAGSLATAYYGTALGGVYAAYAQGKVNHVWVDETRPVNQGARLTAWELMVAGVPSTLIADSMAASVMSQGWVDAVFVGADRIAANGDTANKIGTLMLANLAHDYGVPFYVLAPASTIDPHTPDGASIPIEQRDPRELQGVTVASVVMPDDPVVSRALDALTETGERTLKLSCDDALTLRRKGGGYALDAWFRTTPPNVAVYNPAFDVTPARLISAIVTEKGVHEPDAKGRYRF